MTESRSVQSLGWTRRTAAVSVLLAMEEHRKQAGERLAALRDAQGLNQEELAHLAGVSVKTVSRFENGRHDGSRRTVRAFAKALKVNEHDIIGQPPAPLGLGGESQLDRIEKKLDDLLSLFPAEGLAAALEEEADQLDAQREQSGEAPKRKPRSRKAS